MCFDVSIPLLPSIEQSGAFLIVVGIIRMIDTINDARKTFIEYSRDRLQQHNKGTTKVVPLSSACLTMWTVRGSGCRNRTYALLIQSQSANASIATRKVWDG